MSTSDRRSRLRKAALGIAVGLLLGLALAELHERTTAWPVADAWYRFDEAGGVVRFRCQDFDPIVFSARPSPGTTRVLVVGGSTTFGYPERPGGGGEIRRARHGFVGAMQAALDAAWPGRVELVDLGVNGGSSADTLRILRRAMRWGPSGVVVYDGHNELMSAPARFIPWLWPSALYRRVASTAGRAVTSPGWVGPPAYGTAAHEAAILAELRRNLGRIADLSEAGGVPVVVSTQAGNLAGFDPSWSTASDPSVLREAGALPASELSPLLAASPDAADLAFALGRRQLEAGADAEPALQGAVDHDGLPFRATSQINAVLRDVAAERRLALVDAQKAVRASGAAPGRDLFYDNVHPLPEAASRLAGAMLEGMARAGMLPGAAPPARAIALEGAEALAAERRAAVYWLRWACVRQHDPAYRLSAARSFIDRALARAPDDAESLAILAIIDALADPASPPAFSGSPAMRARLAAIHPRVAALLAATPTEAP